MEEEVGDLFFVLVNIARYLSLDPESALRKTNRKFKQRFQWMEAQLRASGRSPDQASMTKWSPYGSRRNCSCLKPKTSARRLIGIGIGIGMTKSPMVIRNCHGLDELSACVSLQKEVWNFTDAELVPLRMFVVARKSAARSSVHSTTASSWLLPVPAGLPRWTLLSSFAHAGRQSAYRNTGLGRRVKLFQREDALARGFELMEWTFDPLEIKNAYLNIERLGAIARRYHVNQYGITSSPLQGGLPTDRLVAEWWLKSKRVESLL